MRRGHYQKAGPVRIRTADGEEFTQPAYPPRAYWQVVRGHQREAEALNLGAKVTRGAARQRTKLARKIGAGLEALERTVEKRSPA